MEIIQYRLDTQSGAPTEQNLSPDLVLAFGNRQLLEDASHYNQLRENHPSAHLVMCSTAGEIIDETVLDDSIVVTGLKFDRTKIQVIHLEKAPELSSREAGAKIAEVLMQTDGLAGIVVLADGQEVNGSELAAGLSAKVPDHIPVSGGLAGDGDAFTKTLIGLNQAPRSGQLVGIGFYGNSIKIGHGSKGGWDPFGPERIITKSVNNVLFELDGQNALDIYKRYLGEEAKFLPGAALRFPLSIRTESNSEPLVRTILSIDEEAKTMTFAGDLPEGSRARFMKANFDRLVDGAIGAADQSLTIDDAPEFALLISCVGRKLVLGQRVEEEVEGVKDILGKTTRISGFYSYGEISPLISTGKCGLHNQTMTITTLKEV